MPSLAWLNVGQSIQQQQQSVQCLYSQNVTAGYNGWCSSVAEDLMSVRYLVMWCSTPPESNKQQWIWSIRKCMTRQQISHISVLLEQNYKLKYKISAQLQQIKALLIFKCQIKCLCERNQTGNSHFQLHKQVQQMQNSIQCQWQTQTTVRLQYWNTMKWYNARKFL